MAETLHTVFRDTAMVAASLQNLLVACFFGPSEVRHITALYDVNRTAARVFTGGTATLVLVSSKLGGSAIIEAPVPAPDVRDEVVRAIGYFERSLLGCAVVLDEEGIAGSMKRSVASGLLLMARHQHTQVFRELGDAAHWLTLRLNRNAAVAWTAPRVASAAQQLCAEIDAQRGG